MFRIVKTIDELIKAYVIRAIVFCEEQHVSYNAEIDQNEHSALHILGEIDGEPIASGRIRFLGDFAKLERLSIRKAYRGKGLGDQLMQYMLGISREQGFSKFKIHAQIVAKKFYEKHGFQLIGEEFMEANIPHCLMIMED